MKINVIESMIYSFTYANSYMFSEFWFYIDNFHFLRQIFSIDKEFVKNFAKLLDPTTTIISSGLRLWLSNSRSTFLGSSLNVGTTANMRAFADTSESF